MAQGVAAAVAGSWRTTASGVIGGIMLILPSVLALLDSDPATVPSLEAVLAGLALMGLGAAARDNGVTSEQAGARVPPAAPLALLCCVLLAGCVAPEAIEQARHEAAICHGHAGDPSLPLEARQIAADETRAWRAQHLALTGDDVPGASAWPALPAELDAVPGGAPAGAPR